MDPEESRPVALVTGSVRGIGLGVARELASRGWRTHAVWRSVPSPELDERFPGRVHQADLVREDDARRLERRAEREVGREARRRGVGRRNEGERDVVVRQIEIMRMALPALLESGHHDLAHDLELAIAAR